MRNNHQNGTEISNGEKQKHKKKQTLEGNNQEVTNGSNNTDEGYTNGESKKRRKYQNGSDVSQILSDSNTVNTSEDGDTSWRDEKKRKKRRRHLNGDKQEGGDTSQGSSLDNVEVKRNNTKSQTGNGDMITEDKQIKPTTISIAFPSSILDNTLNHLLKTYVTGQIARAAATFKVNEIIIFNEHEQDAYYYSQCSATMRTILEYMECPQYLKQKLFPMTEDLKYAGVLNPLGCPHHLLQHEEFPFREGIVLKSGDRSNTTSKVDVGLKWPINVNERISDGSRVTVQMDYQNSNNPQGRVVSTDQVYQQGLYWGYKVRQASSLAAVLTECPYKGGYDVTLGTSDKGAPVDTLQLPAYRHLLIVFGGVDGLESAVGRDSNLETDDPRHVFDLYINTCPGQGCRTIRTEEAIPITLTALAPKLAQ